MQERNSVHRRRLFYLYMLYVESRSLANKMICRPLFGPLPVKNYTPFPRDFNHYIRTSLRFEIKEGFYLFRRSSLTWLNSITYSSKVLLLKDNFNAISHQIDYPHFSIFPLFDWSCKTGWKWRSFFFTDKVPCFLY